MSEGVLAPDGLTDLLPAEAGVMGSGVEESFLYKRLVELGVVRTGIDETGVDTLDLETDFGVTTEDGTDGFVGDLVLCVELVAWGTGLTSLVGVSGMNLVISSLLSSSYCILFLDHLFEEVDFCDLSFTVASVLGPGKLSLISVEEVLFVLTGVDCGGFDGERLIGTFSIINLSFLDGGLTHCCVCVCV